MCGTPPKIDNGIVSSTGQDYGSKATYQCNQGYKMKGTDTMTCEASGKWFRKAPSCKQSKGKKCYTYVRTYIYVYNCVVWEYVYSNTNNTEG